MKTADGFRFSKKTKRITGYFGAGGDIVFPAEIEGVHVEGFRFDDCDRLESSLPMRTTNAPNTVNGRS